MFLAMIVCGFLVVFGVVVGVIMWLIDRYKLGWRKVNPMNFWGLHPQHDKFSCEARAAKSDVVLWYVKSYRDGWVGWEVTQYGRSLGRHMTLDDKEIPKKWADRVVEERYAKPKKKPEKESPAEADKRLADLAEEPREPSVLEIEERRSARKLDEALDMLTEAHAAGLTEWEPSTRDGNRGYSYTKYHLRSIDQEYSATICLGQSLWDLSAQPIKDFRLAISDGEGETVAVWINNQIAEVDKAGRLATLIDAARKAKWEKYDQVAKDLRERISNRIEED